MKKISFVMALCLTFIACPQEPEVPRIKSVMVSPQNKTVPKGLSQKFIATVDARGGATKNVIWTKVGGGAGTSIDSVTGELTVDVGETADTLTVIATAVDDPAISGEAEVKLVKTTPLYAADFADELGDLTADADPQYFLLMEDLADFSGITLNTKGVNIALFGNRINNRHAQITWKPAATNAASLFVVEDGVILNLENITLNTPGAGTSSCALITVKPNGNLIINDGVTISNILPAPVAGDSETDTTGGSGAGSGVIIFGGALTMNGGSIINNASHAVRFGIDASSTKGVFTMTGGNITGSAGANIQAHGVVIAGNDNHFILEGGTISNYSAFNRTGVRFVEDTKNCSFTMLGGTIKDNAMGIRLVTNGDRSKWTENCSIIMSGGIIENNATYAIRGGGVHDFKFTKTGGEIRIVGTNGILIRSTDDSTNLARRRTPVPADEDMTLVISSSGTEVVSMNGKWN